MANDAADWWRELLLSHERDGEYDAEAGMFSPPYPGSDDPQDEDENRAYKRGFDRRRKELRDRFKWA